MVTDVGVLMGVPGSSYMVFSSDQQSEDGGQAGRCYGVDAPGKCSGGGIGGRP